MEGGFPQIVYRDSGNRYPMFFSSAVPTGSGAFQMPTRPSSVSAASSTFRGEGPISETLQ